MQWVRGERRGDRGGSHLKSSKLKARSSNEYGDSSASSAISVVNVPSLDRANAALARLVSGYRGGEKFAAAIAAGDVCTRADAAERRRICNGCPSKVNASIFGLVPSSWCGPPLDDRMGDEYGSARTCGCLLLGKTLVASERCPRGEWEAVRKRKSPDREGGGVGKTQARPDKLAMAHGSGSEAGVPPEGGGISDTGEQRR